MWQLRVPLFKYTSVFLKLDFTFTWVTSLHLMFTSLRLDSNFQCQFFLVNSNPWLTFILLLTPGKFFFNVRFNLSYESLWHWHKHRSLWCRHKPRSLWSKLFKHVSMTGALTCFNKMKQNDGQKLWRFWQKSMTRWAFFPFKLWRGNYDVMRAFPL
jgi:hypothetical protein